MRDADRVYVQYLDREWLRTVVATFVTRNVSPEARGTFKEYVVFAPDQLYHEFLLFYRREH